jgi:uncharacterized protein
MSDTDKTGAPVEITPGDGRFDVAVDGRHVGFAEYVMHDSQRIFTHTEVDDAYEGRGLATILVRRALEATRDEGLRIVAVCPLVAAFVGKHHEFDDALDPVSTDIKRFLSTR